MIPLRLERLESRDNPAGTVTATLRGSTWTIVGDEADNDILIDPGLAPGSFVLTGSGTAVAGDTTATGVRNIVVRLGDGADDLDVNTTGVTEDLPGKLTINGGDGANSIDVANLRIGRNVVVVNGTNPADGSADDFVQFEDCELLGSLTVRNGDGDAGTQVVRTLGGTSRIAGDLTVVNGRGNHESQALNTDVGGDVAFLNGPQGTGGGPRRSSLFNAFSAGGAMRIGGDVRIAYESGDEPTDDLVADAAVAGNLRVDYGTAAGSIEVEGRVVVRPVTVGGSVSIAGRGSVSATLGSGSPDKGLVVGKALRVSVLGEASILLADALVLGATRIVTGGGADYVQIDDSTLHRLFISTGDGGDSINLERASGTDGVTRLLGKATIDLGAGAAEAIGVGLAGDATARVEILAATRLAGAEIPGVFNVFDPLGLLSVDAP